jgi:hypothetical protein
MSSDVHVASARSPPATSGRYTRRRPSFIFHRRRLGAVGASLLSEGSQAPDAQVTIPRSTGSPASRALTFPLAGLGTRSIKLAKRCDDWDLKEYFGGDPLDEPRGYRGAATRVSVLSWVLWLCRPRGAPRLAYLAAATSA